jgi:hypothetical protein
MVISTGDEHSNPAIGSRMVHRMSETTRFPSALISYHVDES